MTTMTCPSCQTRLTVTAGRPVHRLPVDPNVRQLVESLSGRFTFAELRDEYARAAAGNGWPALSDKALARRLRSSGARPYRTAAERGWEI